jgi:integrase
MAILTKRVLDAAKPRDKEYFAWCGGLRGFGARIYPSGRKIFIAQVRVGRGQRRIKIGPFGALTVEQARERAAVVICAAADGRDPQREKQELRRAFTVQELCEQYMDAARSGLVTTRFREAKRSTTLEVDAGRIARHIAPLIGRIPARELRRVDVQRMADAIAAGKTASVVKTKPRGRAVVTGGAGTAARAVGLLGGIFSWAQKRALVPEGVNPAHGVEIARGKAKDRVLKAEELEALGKVLNSRAIKNTPAVNLVRLIALTGLRLGEASGLKWREVDELGQCLRLESTKTGRSTRPIGKIAMNLLSSMPRADREWVFPRTDGQPGPADSKKPTAKLFDAAGLADARSHDLRRTFASVAADLGFGDATISELLGHARRGVTERYYVRRSDPVLLAAADTVAAQIAAGLAGSQSNTGVKPLPAQHAAG